eukprot:CAMPEP_0184016600 /NCGR_PEP_ID=MMETSP0954-20121128/7021_1 /TAXON_ID=627963 /ORGANISM="Aplanochytrium sp, Strain PBS07" /LENGTH=293 /DNA_ID=CAMNT_0026297643 /DNA_START=249 /DNA_END=1130 /DNA_ORIENTATION=-
MSTRVREVLKLVAAICLMLIASSLFSTVDKEEVGTTNKLFRKGERRVFSENEVEEVCEREFDAILILGGGVPMTENLPPPWVQTRADIAGRVYNCIKGRGGETSDLSFVTLSGGSAHAKQLLKENGLPVWESGATARYLIEEVGIPGEKIVIETSSYDTIGNAYFSRAAITDVRDWSRLLVITSDFHIRRTEAIFQWVFSLPAHGRPSEYEIVFLQTSSTGLTTQQVMARKQREDASLRNVNKLKENKDIQSLASLHNWLQTHHSLYAASLLASQPEKIPKALRKSYGSHSRI